jgi:hypothetical protein
VQDFAVKSADNLYTFLYIFLAREHDPEAADMNQNQSKSPFRQDNRIDLMSCAPRFQQAKRALVI